MDNSRFKFRAWDKEYEKMTIPYTLDELLANAHPFHRAVQDDYIWMQFTGLTDSEGKEIYEGDVCVCPATYPFFDGEERNYVGIIEWVQCNCAFELILKCVNPNKRGISDGINQSLSYFENIKIIGNIFTAWKGKNEVSNDTK